MVDDGRQPEDEPERPLATISLCLLWIALYLAMGMVQGSLHAEGGRILSGGIQFATAHQFGTMTPVEVLGGHWWRALTATCIHLSLMHLGFNLLMFYQVGRMVEPWYGPGLFVAVYVVIGFLGNILAAFGRLYMPWVSPTPMAASGGGSGVICGLIALIAVVGWRSKTRTGRYYSSQMVGLLLFIALIGLAIPHVGNFEHAGGALAGALVGLAHRRLVRLRVSRQAQVVGVLSVLLLLTSGVLQAREGWYEHQGQTASPFKLQEIQALQSRLQKREKALGLIRQLGQVYQVMALKAQSPLGFLDPPDPTLRWALQKQLEQLEAQAPELKEGSTADAFQRFGTLLFWATVRWPLPDEIAAFPEAEQALNERLQREQSNDLAQFQKVAGPNLRIIPEGVLEPPARAGNQRKAQKDPTEEP